MTFTARLRKSSYIYSTWRGERRIQGRVGNAVFKLVPGLDYATGELTPEQVEELRHHPSVQLEMSGVTPADIVVDETIVEPHEDEDEEAVDTPSAEPEVVVASAPQAPGIISDAEAARIAEAFRAGRPKRNKGHRR